MKTSLLFVVVALALVMVIGSLAYFSDDHQDYLRLSDQRARWHQKCDRYMNIPLTNVDAARCNDELNAMMAYAKQRGWN